MAITVDPDDCTLATDYTVSTGNVWFNPNTFGIGIDPSYDSNMDDDGLSFQCLHTFAVKLWLSNASYASMPFPFESLGEDRYEVSGGWDFEGTDVEDKSTRHYVRDGGWNVRNSSGNITQTWICIRGNGDASLISNEGTATYFDLGEGSGTVQRLEGSYISNTKSSLPINECFMVYRNDDGSGTLSGNDFDLTDNAASLSIREYGKTYARGSTADIAVEKLDNRRFTLSFPDITTDLNVSASFADANGGVAPYNGMSFEFENSAQSQSLGANGPYNFGVTVTANGGTVQQVYEFHQAKLLSATDIDATAGGTNTQYGLIIGEFMRFVGPVLESLQTDTPDAGGAGVYVDGFDQTQTALMKMTDNTNVLRVFPRLSTMVLTFGENAQNDPDAVYRVFYNTGDSYASTVFPAFNSPIVQDKDGDNIAGNIVNDSDYSNGVITKIYAYDEDQQGAGSGGNDRNIMLVVNGKEVSQYARQAGVITETGAPVTISPGLERNYNDPA